MTNPADDDALRAQRALRVGDAERNSALTALGEHLAAGRITLDEYGERNANIMISATCGELADVFGDLPAPHPVLPGPYAAALLPPPGAGASQIPTVGHHVAPAGLDQRAIDQRAADQRSRAQKIVAVVSSLSVFVALALFFLTGTWLWFLLIPAISGVAGAIWGPDWKEPRRGEIDGRRRELD